MSQPAAEPTEKVRRLAELADALRELDERLAAIAANAQACEQWIGASPSDLEEASAAARRIVRDAQRARDAIARAVSGNRTGVAMQRERAGIGRRHATLTPREREVLDRIVLGRLNKQVAADLGISEIMVKVHRRHVMQKMAAGSLAALVRMVERLGPRPGVVAE